MRIQIIARLAFSLILAQCSIACRHGDVDNRPDLQPTSRPSDVLPTMSVQTGAGTPSSSLHVQVSVFNGSKFENAYEVDVCIQGERAAYVTRSGSGLPYLYSTAGFSIRVDHQVPGRLLVVTRGLPEVILRDEGPEIRWWVAHTNRLLRPVVDIDLTSILRRPGLTLVEKSDTAAVFREGSMAVATRMITSSPAVERFTIEVEHASRIEVSSIRTGESRFLPLPMSMPEGWARGVAVPIVDVTNDPPSGWSPFPPRTFGSDKLEVRAALEIQRLLSRVQSPNLEARTSINVVHGRESGGW